MSDQNPRSTVRDLNQEDDDLSCLAWDRVQQLPEFGQKWLTDLMRSDSDPQVRAGAARGLHWMELQGVLDILMPALHDPSPTVRARIAELVGKQYADEGYEPVRELLHDTDPNVRIAAITSLNYIAPEDEDGHADMEALRTALVDAEALVRARAIDAFEMRYEDLNLDLLLGALQDEDTEVRQRAAHWLAVRAQSRSDEARLAVLQHSDEHVRAAYVKQLHDAVKWGCLRNAHARRLAVDSLRDPSPVVRAAAAETLGKFGPNRSTLSALRRALKDNAVEVRCKAIWSLGWLKDAQSLDLITAELHSRETRLRYAAVSAMAEIGDRTVLPLLHGLDNDESWVVRSQAASVARRLGDTSMSESLMTLHRHRSARVRQMAVFAALGLKTERAAQVIGEALSDASVDVRLNAEVACWDVIFVEQLVALAGDAATTTTERRNIAHTLAQIEDERATQALAGMLKYEDVGAEAAELLGYVAWKHGDVAAGALEEAVNSASPAIRDAAASALASLKRKNG